jgi:hypothetical protein
MNPVWVTRWGEGWRAPCWPSGSSWTSPPPSGSSKGAHQNKKFNVNTPEVMRILAVHTGSEMFIPDQGFELFHTGSRVKKASDPGSWSAAKNLGICNPKNLYLALVNMIWDVYFWILDPGSQIWIFSVPDPGSATLHACSWIKNIEIVEASPPAWSIGWGWGSWDCLAGPSGRSRQSSLPKCSRKRD